MYPGANSAAVEQHPHHGLRSTLVRHAELYPTWCLFAREANGPYDGATEDQREREREREERLIPTKM
ncbi:hypothetical protein VN97_g3676 [Penicillium thymicola]|uniref:Uncharacterized protein n=1 Tax=Penicillium thymicola TaxID=293382 RepID=A0AAI9TLV8_PENTH|nr:hypothetical protein VN97_g3676 [Penicillium thymicola]